jgi:hypothetical protein
MREFYVAASRERLAEWRRNRPPNCDGSMRAAAVGRICNWAGHAVDRQRRRMKRSAVLFAASALLLALGNAYGQARPDVGKLEYESNCASCRGVQARSFAELLEQTIRRYQNRAIEAAQVIEELIGLAKKMREAHARGEALKLSEDELAFDDALETNDSAVKVLGDDPLRTIAQESVKTVRANGTIDWTLRENVRAQLRVLVKRILRKYGYPPDKQEKATQTVLEQTALLSARMGAA